MSSASPDLACELYQRGQALFDIDRPEKAIAVVTQGMAGTPLTVDQLVLLAQCHAALEQFDLARQAAEAAIRADPESHHAHGLLARLLITAPEQAWPHALTASRLAPHDWWAAATVAQVAAHLPAKQADAWAAARKGVSLAPNEPDAHLALAYVAAVLGDRSEVRSATERALALQPDHPGAHEQLALLDADQARTGRAVRGWVTSARLNPTNAEPTQRLQVIARRVALLVTLIMLGPWLLMGAMQGPVSLAQVLWLVSVIGFGALLAFTLRGAPRATWGTVAEVVRRDRRTLAVTSLAGVAVLISTIDVATGFHLGTGLAVATARASSLLGIGATLAIVRVLLNRR